MFKSYVVNIFYFPEKYKTIMCVSLDNGSHNIQMRLLGNRFQRKMKNKTLILPPADYLPLGLKKKK